MKTFLQLIASAMVVPVAYAQWSNAMSYSNSHALNTSTQPSPVKTRPGTSIQPSSDNIILHTPSSLDQANISIVNTPGTSLTTLNATITISVGRASYPWLPSDVPVQTFLSLKSCDKVWVDYSSAHRESYVITTTYPVSSPITEVTHTNNDIPVITLCDGIPRAGITTESSITRYLVTSEVTKWSYVTNGTDQPSCSWNLQSCSTLWSLWDRQSTSWRQTATGLEPFSDAPDYWIPECSFPDTCEKSCFLFGTEEVDLYYFPEPWSTDIICGPNATRTSPWDITMPQEQKRAPSTIAIGNMTFTSPSAYLYFSTMYARAGYPTIGASKCGYDMSSVWVPVDPGELSTLPRRSKPQLAKPITFANLAMTTVNGYEIPLVPSSAYWWPNSCHDNPYLLRNKCPPSTIHNDYRPDILYRTELQELQPHWKNCKPLSQVAAMIYAMRDPPIPLTTAGNLVGDPGTTTSVHEPFTTSSKAAEPSQPATGLLPTNTSPQSAQKTDKQSDPTQTGLADPGVSGPGDPGSDPGTSDPGKSAPGGTSPGGPDPGAADPGSSDDPGSSGPGSSDPGTDNNNDNDSNNINDPPAAVTIDLPPKTASPAAAAVVTLDGSPYTALPGQDLTLGTTAVNAGQAAATLSNGQVVSIGGAGVVVVSGAGASATTATHAYGDAAAAPGPAPVSAAVVTVGGQTLTAAVDGQGGAGFVVVFGTAAGGGSATTLTAGGVAVTLDDGQAVSVASDGVVVGGSTVPFSAVDDGGGGRGGDAVVLSVGGSATTVDGHTISLAPSGVVVVDGIAQTLQSGSAGGAVITVDGQTFSVAGAAGSAAVGGATGTATEAVLTIGSETVMARILSGHTGIVVVGDQTLSVGGAPVTTTGVVLSAGIDGVVINKTTTETFADRTWTGSDASPTRDQTGAHTTSGGSSGAATGTLDVDQASSASALENRCLFVLLTAVVGFLMQ